jgi:hypothetical protein
MLRSKALQDLGLVALFAAVVAFAGCASAPKAEASAEAAPAVAASVIDDPLNDLSKMESHSADLEFDTKNPAAYPNGDESRVWPTTAEPQNFVYKIKDPASFSFVVGYYTYKHSHDPKLVSFNAYVSPDAKSWTEVPAVRAAEDNGAWLFGDWKNAAEIPAGNQFIKFEFSDKDLKWSSEISEVHVQGR